ncbi:hypothetical protein C7M84_021492 [Penaeus vannamei]|uniref:Protein kinase domain-containing protein n=1 Tax=Penaeus vannamei TaxID=6689 RepID=A0A3R7MG08_PENVA|nr:hypothetical protein C7M84_021492 [Penaeus vannamei]
MAQAEGRAWRRGPPRDGDEESRVPPAEEAKARQGLPVRNPSPSKQPSRKAAAKKQAIGEPLPRDGDEEARVPPAKKQRQEPSRQDPAPRAAQAVRPGEEAPPPRRGRGGPECTGEEAAPGAFPSGTRAPRAAQAEGRGEEAPPPRRGRGGQSATGEETVPVKPSAKKPKQKAVAKRPLPRDGTRRPECHGEEAAPGPSRQEPKPLAQPKQKDLAKKQAKKSEAIGQEAQAEGRGEEAPPPRRDEEARVPPRRSSARAFPSGTQALEQPKQKAVAKKQAKKSLSSLSASPKKKPSATCAEPSAKKPKQKAVAKRPLPRDGDEEARVPPAKKQRQEPSRQEPKPLAQPKQKAVAKKQAKKSLSSLSSSPKKKPSAKKPAKSSSSSSPEVKPSAKKPKQKAVAKRPLPRDGDEEARVPPAKKQRQEPSRQEPKPLAQPKQKAPSAKKPKQKAVAKRPLPRDGDEEARVPPAKKQRQGPSRQEPKPLEQPKQKAVAKKQAKKSPSRRPWRRGPSPATGTRRPECHRRRSSARGLPVRNPSPSSSPSRRPWRRGPLPRDGDEEAESATGEEAAPWAFPSGTQAPRAAQAEGRGEEAPPRDGDERPECHRRRSSARGLPVRNPSPSSSPSRRPWRRSRPRSHPSRPPAQPKQKAVAKRPLPRDGDEEARVPPAKKQRQEPSRQEPKPLEQPKQKAVAKKQAKKSLSSLSSSKKKPSAKKPAKSSSSSSSSSPLPKPLEQPKQKAVAKRPLPRDGDEEARVPPAKKQRQGPSRQEPKPLEQPKQKAAAKKQAKKSLSSLSSSSKKKPSAKKPAKSSSSSSSSSPLPKPLEQPKQKAVAKSPSRDGDEEARVPPAKKQRQGLPVRNQSPSSSPSRRPWRRAGQEVVIFTIIVIKKKPSAKKPAKSSSSSSSSSPLPKPLEQPKQKAVAKRPLPRRGRGGQSATGEEAAPGAFPSGTQAPRAAQAEGRGEEAPPPRRGRGGQSATGEEAAPGAFPSGTQAPRAAQAEGRGEEAGQEVIFTIIVIKKEAVGQEACEVIIILILILTITQAPRAAQAEGRGEEAPPPRRGRGGQSATGEEAAPGAFPSGTQAPRAAQAEGRGEEALPRDGTRRPECHRRRSSARAFPSGTQAPRAAQAEGRGEEAGQGIHRGHRRSPSRRPWRRGPSLATGTRRPECHGRRSSARSLPVRNPSPSRSPRPKCPQRIRRETAMDAICGGAQGPEAAVARLSVPILSAKKAMAMLGPNPHLLGAGKDGEAYLNREADLVVKFAMCYRSCRSVMREALALDLLKEVPGVQRLVGVCLERALIVTRYAGPTMSDWKSGKSRLRPKVWLYILSKVTLTLRTIHRNGLVHNDVKGDNICLRKSKGEIDVTIIDFGLAKRAGMQLPPLGTWSPGEHHPPEFFRDQAECSDLTDAFSLGKLVRAFLDIQSQELLDWFQESQSHAAKEREGLSELLWCLKLEQKTSCTGNDDARGRDLVGDEGGSFSASCTLLPAGCLAKGEGPCNRYKT